MKTGWKVFLIILAVLILIGGSIVFWQWKTLKALSGGAKYTPEEIETRIQEQEENLRQTVNEIPDLTVREPTEEEKAAFREGTISRDELIGMITSPEAPQAQSGTAAPAETEPDASGETGETAGGETASGGGESAGGEEEEKNGEYEEKLSQLIAEIYVLREEFSGMVSDLEGRAISEYRGFTAEQKSKSALLSWAAGYVREARELEKACDARMDAILDEFEALISEYNGDRSLIDKLAQAYQDEKDLKVSYYMAELRKRGLI